MEKVWLKQDGATAHTARASMQVLREMFPGRLISKSGYIPWSARSLDLTPCDFFLWEYVKFEIHKHRPRNLETLKEAIHTEIRRIHQVMLEKVMQTFSFHLKQYIDNKGHHFNKI